jgi:hypothetical protein
VQSKDVYNFFDLAFRTFILKTTKFFIYAFIALFLVNIIISYCLINNKLDDEIYNLGQQVTKKKNFIESLLNNIKYQLTSVADPNISKVLAQSYDFFNGTYISKDDIENLEWMQIVPYRKAINMYGVLDQIFLNKKINLCANQTLCYDLDSDNGHISFYTNKINLQNKSIILITLPLSKFIVSQEINYDYLDISIDNKKYYIINQELGRQIINKQKDLSFLQINLGISYKTFIKTVLVRQLYILISLVILHLVLSIFLWLFIHLKKNQINDLKKRIFAHDVSTESFANYSKKLCLANLKNASKAKEFLNDYINNSEPNTGSYTPLNQVQDIIEDISENIFFDHISKQLCLEQLISEALNIFAEEILIRKIRVTKSIAKESILINHNIYPLIVGLIYYHFLDISYGGNFCVKVKNNNEETNIKMTSDIFNSPTQNYNHKIASVDQEILLHNSAFDKVAEKIGVTLKIQNGEQRKTTLILRENKEEQSKANVVNLFE